VSYPLRRSFKRIGISYSYDRSSLVAVSDASKILFTNINFRGISGPNALNGIITSKIVPSFTMNTLDAAYQPHHGKSIFIGGEFSGLGGTVYTMRPIIQYKQFFPVNKHRNAIGYNLQGSFISGYNGVVAPPFERAYLGGDNDLRGFDIRTISPITFLPSTQTVSLRNPDNSFVPKDPNIPVGADANGRCAPVVNCWNIPVPFQQLVTPGGDLSLTGNLEYRITIAGPVVLAPFVDLGVNPIIRTSQLKINQGQFDDLAGTLFGCPALDFALQCKNGQKIQFSQFLQPVPGTNWVPRMSTGIELQVMLPVINAPFRIYWAYNPLRLDTNTNPPVPITQSMFPFKDHPGAAAYTFQNTIDSLGPNYTLREPRKTFRFSVSTTF
jgi:outer membrane protein insertion porin family